SPKAWRIPSAVRLAPDSNNLRTSSGTSRSTVFRSEGSLEGGGLTLIKYLVGLILAVTCTACRAPSGDEISQAAQPASVAGARLFETAKAKDSITDVRPSMEEVPAAAQPTAQATSHLSYCDRGFRTTGNPRVDLARLGALCGPS